MRKAIELASLGVGSAGGSGSANPALQRLSNSAAATDRRPHALQSPRQQARAGKCLAAFCASAVLCGLLLALLVPGSGNSNSAAGGGEDDGFVDSRLQLPPGFVATR